MRGMKRFLGVELLDLLSSEFDGVVHRREDRIQDLGDAVPVDRRAGERLAETCVGDAASMASRRSVALGYCLDAAPRRRRGAASTPPHAIAASRTNKDAPRSREPGCQRGRRDAGHKPSGQKSATISGSRSGDSHLFTARTVSISEGHFRRNAAMSSSVRTMPVLPSTTTTAHDSLRANEACSRISARNWSDSRRQKVDPQCRPHPTRTHHSARW